MVGVKESWNLNKVLKAGNISTGNDFAFDIQGLTYVNEILTVNELQSLTTTISRKLKAIAFTSHSINIGTGALVIPNTDNTIDIPSATQGKIYFVDGITPKLYIYSTTNSAWFNVELTPVI